MEKWENVDMSNDMIYDIDISIGITEFPPRTYYMAVIVMVLSMPNKDYKHHHHLAQWRYYGAMSRRR